MARFRRLPLLLLQVLLLLFLDSFIPLHALTRVAAISTPRRPHLHPSRIDISRLFGPDVPCPGYPIPVPLPDFNSTAIGTALQDIDAAIAAVVRDNAFPGFILHVVYGDQVLLSRGYGRQDPFDSSSPPPTAASLYRVASISKVFTSLLLFHLRDEGLVSLDDPVVRFLPGFRPLANPLLRTRRPITLRQLASHTSGLQRENPIGWLNGDLDELLAAVREQMLVLPQYSTPHYSNLGFTLLGRALQSAVSSSYEQYMEKSFLPALNMTASGFTYTAATKKLLAVGVDGDQPAPVSPCSLCMDNPCGGLFASATDIGRFMSLLFRRRAAGDTDRGFLDPSTVNEFLTAVSVLPDGGSGFGLPFELNYSTATHTWYTGKAGSWTGYRSQMTMALPYKLGVFTSVQLSEIDDPTVYNNLVLDRLIPVLDAALRQIPHAVPLPPQPSLYVGEYEDGVAVLYNTSAQLLTINDGTLLSFISISSLNSSAALHVFSGRVADQQQDCRWLDDGANGEYWYFTVSDGQVRDLWWMGSHFAKTATASYQSAHRSLASE